MADPGAEMKARAEQEASSIEDKHGTCCGDIVHLFGFELAEALAAFAAKEVARALVEANNRLRQIEEFLLGRDQRESPAESLAALLARAVEEEREANCKAVCEHCRNGAYESPILEGKLWIHTKRTSGLKVHCWAHYIHERSQVKGEGL